MHKVLGNLEKGLVFVMSAPAGTGKTTLARMLLNDFSCVVQSIAYTTRKVRPEEVDGVHYSFITKDEFKQKIENDEFLEYAKVYEDYYGTSRQWVQEQINTGKHVLLVIDTQGALQVKQKIKATLIFIQPPSMDVLRERLMKRQTENDKTVKKRLDWANKEIEKKSNYDYLIVNDDLKVAYQVLRSILIAEEHKQE